MTKQELQALLNDLSIEEKIGEISQTVGSYFIKDVEGALTDHKYSDEHLALMGSTFNVGDPELINRIQKKHIENHPHHIPMMFMGDICHGFSTIFPVALAQGCSFDPELVKKVAKLTAMESSVCGIHINYAPAADVSRDARWGRAVESYGEDVYLNCRMAEASVKGYQNDDLDKEGTMGACFKHFAGYGAVEAGREYGVVDVSERSLRQDYLPPYKAACDAGAVMAMAAFNAISGVPCNGSQYLLQKILRDEWKWDGAVISDWGSLNFLRCHGITHQYPEMAEIGVKSRMAIEMCSQCYWNGMKTALENGKITMEEIDRLVFDVLNLKNKLGLFENPYRFADPEKLKEVKDLPSTRAEAQKMVCESSVLLKNDGILPLENKGQKIAFVGPYVDNDDILGYCVIGGIDRPNAQTVKSALEERFEKNNFVYADDCKMFGNEDQRLVEFLELQDEMMNDADREAAIAKAVEAVRDCDTVVMLIGEHRKMGGELAARTEITVPEIQMELFRRVSRVNDNIVTVLFNQRPMDIVEISEKSKALLDVWFPGTMGAQAIVDMLFGVEAPSGKLTMSFPYTVGQCPIYYNSLPTDHSTEFHDHHATGYIDCPTEPYYPFGYGLTYTDFSYSKVKINQTEMTANETITAEVEVTNTGKRDGYEAVQLYLRDMDASVSRPYKELKGFKKVFIKSGETVKVTFDITVDLLKIYDVNMDYVAEPGEFRVFAGPNCLVSEYETFYLK